MNGMSRLAGKSRSERRCARRSGFTLVESLISIMILGIAATGISVLFNSGLMALNQGEEVLLYESALRSQMESLISRPFQEVLTEASGSQNYVIQGVTYTVQWTAVNHDLNGDGLIEPDAMLVQASLDGRLVSVILVDDGGRLGVMP